MTIEGEKRSRLQKIRDRIAKREAGLTDDIDDAMRSIDRGNPSGGLGADKPRQDLSPGEDESELAVDREVKAFLRKREYRRM